MKYAIRQAIEMLIAVAGICIGMTLMAATVKFICTYIFTGAS